MRVLWQTKAAQPFGSSVRHVAQLDLKPRQLQPPLKVLHMRVEMAETSRVVEVRILSEERNLKTSNR